MPCSKRTIDLNFWWISRISSSLNFVLLFSCRTRASAADCSEYRIRLEGLARSADMSAFFEPPKQFHTI